MLDIKYSFSTNTATDLNQDLSIDLPGFEDMDSLIEALDNLREETERLGEIFLQGPMVYGPETGRGPDTGDSNSIDPEALPSFDGEEALPHTEGEPGGGAQGAENGSAKDTTEQNTSNGIEAPTNEDIRTAGAQSINSLLAGLMEGDSLSESLEHAGKQLQNNLLFGNGGDDQGLIGGMMSDMDTSLSQALSSLSQSLMDGFMSIFDFRALGGPVSSNQPYIVGEQGPELFVPSGSGNVLTNSHTSSIFNDLRGSGTAAMGPDKGVTVNVMNNSDATASTKRRRDGNGAEVIDVMIGEATSNMMRGGSMARAIETRYGLKPNGM